ncbi:MAG: tripartite tricarboxylate transporter substrate-binding protein [Burkholderiales bacterium]
MKRIQNLVLMVALAVWGGAPALSQCPSKPVRLIVPFAPGGGTDIVARVMAQKANELTRQSVIVDNRGGAGGLIGTELAVRATPDGYTLGVVTASLPISAAASRLPFDPVNDLALISMIGETGYVLTLHPTVPARTTKELIAYAKANPGKLTYGSSGTGGTAHLSGELFDLTRCSRVK